MNNAFGGSPLRSTNKTELSALLQRSHDFVYSSSTPESYHQQLDPGRGLLRVQLCFLNLKHLFSFSFCVFLEMSSTHHWLAVTPPEDLLLPSHISSSGHGGGSLAEPLPGTFRFSHPAPPEKVMRLPGVHCTSESSYLSSL